MTIEFLSNLPHIYISRSSPNVNRGFLPKSILEQRIVLAFSTAQLHNIKVQVSLPSLCPCDFRRVANMQQYPPVVLQQHLSLAAHISIYFYQSF